MTDKEALIILNAIPGLGPKRIRSLIQFFGSPQKILSLNEEALRAAALVPSDVIKNILEFDKNSFLKEENRLLESCEAQILSYLDPSFPKNLAEIPDAPVVLYIKGKIPANLPTAIAIVGSRHASIYGTGVAEKFAMQLAELGIPIVSGMARGIDTAVHRGVLRVKGATIAVLGSGLSVIYPSENKNLFLEIAATGAVISEFPMATEPLAHNFPRRNRIISGLSLGVIVVEASLNSGALITADFALEQGREVFAIPGKIDSPNSQGVHRLIKEGAKLAGSIEDVLEELAPKLGDYLQQKQAAPSGPEVREDLQSLSDAEKIIYNHVPTSPIHIDELAQKCESSVSSTMGILLKLEMKHLIKQLPGKYYVQS